MCLFLFVCFLAINNIQFDFWCSTFFARSLHCWHHPKMDERPATDKNDICHHKKKTSWDMLEKVNAETKWIKKKAKSFVRNLFWNTLRLYINISSVVEFQRWWVLESKIFAMWWPGFKDFIWFFEMEEHWASEAHKNEFLNYEVLKI